MTVVPDRDVFHATLLVVGMDESADDAGPVSPILVLRCWSAVSVIRVRDGIATVVGVPRLGLEREKNRGPAIVARLVNDETTVGPDSVVVPMLVAITLVHVDVVDAVAGCEPEHLVRRAMLWSPARAEGKEPARRIGSQALDVEIELVDEIIAWTGTVGGNAPHVATVEHPTSLVVQR